MTAHNANTPFRFIFFGTPEFAAIILEKLIAAGLVPAAVVCNPDRPAGRKQVMTAPPVKQLIANRKAQIKILQPESLTSYVLNLKSYIADFFIVAAYAKIIPKQILELPRLGTIGVHPSLLPKYRGASPIQSAILNDEKETGVTLYLMDEKVDHGPVLGHATWDMGHGETYETLMRKLAELAGDLLVKTIPDFVAGKITPHEQNHPQAIYTKKFRTEDGQVDLEKDDPKTVWLKIRALNPEPGVWTMNYPGYVGKRVKLLEADFVPRHSRERPALDLIGGENLTMPGSSPNMTEKNDLLRLKKIQVEGKRPIDIQAS